MCIVSRVTSWYQMCKQELHSILYGFMWRNARTQGGFPRRSVDRGELVSTSSLGLGIGLDIPRPIPESKTPKISTSRLSTSVTMLLMAWELRLFKTLFLVAYRLGIHN